jgi:competence protein ComEC
VAAAVVLRRLPRRRRGTAIASFVSLALTFALAACAFRPTPSWVTPSGLRVTFLDVGQGDAVLVEAPGAAVLFDQGPPEADVAGQLRHVGVRALTAIVLTHPQRDHIGGAANVLERLSVGTVVDPAIAAPSPDHDAAIAAARARNVPVMTVRAGDAYVMGRLRLRILWPADAGVASDDPNRHAVVALVTYGVIDVLLTADAESDVTLRLPLRPVEILKVAHHGSEDTGLPDLLRILRPRIAVVSVGEGNDYDHPRAETMAALAAAPALQTYRTDRDGRIVVESNGGTVVVRSER